MAQLSFTPKIRGMDRAPLIALPAAHSFSLSKEDMYRWYYDTNQHRIPLLINTTTQYLVDGVNQEIDLFIEAIYHPKPKIGQKWMINKSSSKRNLVGVVGMLFWINVEDGEVKKVGLTESRKQDPATGYFTDAVFTNITSLRYIPTNEELEMAYNLEKTAKNLFWSM